jgi:D-beta-D-heptose 7-phosphate kinase/D-beta-D-heptose 1-phosphate adenosyltransferase
MSRPHVVVVGDVVLDRDVDGRTDRLCPDAPVPVLDVTQIRESPGGAGLAALLCSDSGARVTLVAPIAEDTAGRRLVELLTPAVDLVRIGHAGPTRRKIRIRSSGQSLVRIDDGGPGTPTDAPEETCRDTLRAADVVLVSDYGAGVTTDQRLRALLTEAAQRVPVVWDPHPRGGIPIPGALVVTPNLAEARSAPAAGGLHGGTTRDAPPDVLAAGLAAAWGARAVCLTAGHLGAFLAVTGTEPQFIPAPAVAGGDSCGAGDCFAATVAAAIGHGSLLSEAVAMGVARASAWVTAGGAEAFRVANGPNRATAEHLTASDTRVAPLIPGPDTSGSLEQLAAGLRAGGRTLVATGGCFDIVHAGHVATLQAARRLGDALVVLINSDASVARLKGPDRPVIGAADRARVLAAFDCVDAVAVFDEDDPRRALSALRPDVWVKGGDYGATPLPEADLIRSNGGRVVLLPYLSGRSTTTIIERSRHGRDAHLKENNDHQWPRQPR